MRRYRIIAGLLLGLFLLLFLLVEALGVPLLTDPSPWLARGGMLAALVGVGLLVVDVVLPVPASLVMVAHGALFGVVGGTLLSLLGVWAPPCSVLASAGAAGRYCPGLCRPRSSSARTVC